MFEVFKKYIIEKAGLNDEELEKIETSGIEKKVRKKQYILQEGDVCRHNCFVVRGCLRLYRVDDAGVEHILRFAVENWWISDRESFNTGKPSKSNIDALEDSEVLLWTKDNFEQLLTEIPALSAFTERLLSKSFNVSQDRLYTTISGSAEQRYHDFMKSYPNLFDRVPLHMIASYLGVSRETLSRIRK